MTKRHTRRLAAYTASLLLLVSTGLSTAAAQTVPNRYTLILDDPPLSARFPSTRGDRRSIAVESYRRQIIARQDALKRELQSRNIQVTGAVQSVLNAVFVTARPDRVNELKSLPGVKGVVPARRYKRALNRATQLLDGPAAWNVLGGQPNAGAGIRIAILDSGIEQTNPAFQDSTLKAPQGFPVCNQGPFDCGAFTNGKVIVARSYVGMIAAGTSPTDPSADSRPDDLTPRDRDGHGTAVASCAAAAITTGAVTFSGMAPKAYLGNYKIYGSPGVNDSTTDQAIVRAAEDAQADGMDVLNFSSGGPEFSGPLDSGAACGVNPGVPCDLVAATFENLAQSGMVVVAAAGNEGQDGSLYPTPTYNTISSPGNAPSVIAPGAATNGHTFFEAVTLAGSDVPSNLQSIVAVFGDGFVPASPLTAPVVDVAALGNDGYACSALPAGSLAGDIALIERGPQGNACAFSDKLFFAQTAGAVGIIFYNDNSGQFGGPGGLSGTTIPAAMISNADGLALKSFLASHPGHAATIDATPVEESATPNLLAGFSSRGPAVDGSVKPDLVATGTSIYMAAETYDPLGALFSTNGFAVADGTSFATPLTAGAAALVKQAHPSYTSAQIKSALVNTAAQTVMYDDSGNSVELQSTGAGLLDAGAAVNATVSVTPATASLGFLSAGAPLPTVALTITNNGSAAVNLALAVAPNPSLHPSVPALSKTSVSLTPGGSDTVNVAVTGSVPAPEVYQGNITMQGNGISLHVPYYYVVGDGVPKDIIPLTGQYFDGTVGQGIPDGVLSFRLIDQYGAPVANAPVTWTARNGGSLQNADATTDINGLAAVQPVLGTQPGNYTFTATAPNLQRLDFSGTARAVPVIASGGVLNAASGSATAAPGSYVSIYGAGLSDFTDGPTGSRLPLSIDLVNVSFDVPGAGISVPGYLSYVSPGQVNVLVPWELQGQSSAKVKVTIDYSVGNVVTVPLATYAPAFFETVPNTTVAALDEGFHVVSSTNPVVRGHYVQLYVNGLGPVSNQPASGDPAPADTLAETTAQPQVTIGGQNATVQFSGLAPGWVGLYQVNALVPTGISAGNQPITIAIGGVTSKTSGIPVQ